LKKSIVKVEFEVDNIRNKKVRGALKKQKDMLKSLNDKLKLMRTTRGKCEELATTMGFLEGGAIKPLKTLLKKYNEDVDNDEARGNVDSEVGRLISLADQNR
jgi:ferric iron reductase protein FhuF